jgi:hypothetical protein
MNVQTGYRHGSTWDLLFFPLRLFVARPARESKPFGRSKSQFVAGRVCDIRPAPWSGGVL